MLTDQPRALVENVKGYGYLWVYGPALEGRTCQCGGTFEYCPGVMDYPATTTDPASYDCPEGFPLTHNARKGCRAENVRTSECCTARR